MSRSTESRIVTCVLEEKCVDIPGVVNDHGRAYGRETLAVRLQPFVGAQRWGLAHQARKRQHRLTEQPGKEAAAQL